MDPDEIDRTGLISESYRIAGIKAAECRSIFLDWALKLAPEIDPKAAISALIETYGTEFPAHPMTSVLLDGLGDVAETGRRGGRRGRLTGPG